jgi:hypothetical protein
LTIDPITVDSAVVCNARTIINFIDEIKNVEITAITLHRLKTLFQSLAESYNSIPGRAFPIDFIENGTDKIGFEIRSTYQPNLKFSEMPRFIIDILRFGESHMDEHRCLDALCVLRDYCNITIYSRFDHGLVLEPRLDDRTPSSLISTHKSIGDRL